MARTLFNIVVIVLSKQGSRGVLREIPPFISLTASFSLVPKARLLIFSCCPVFYSTELVVIVTGEARQKDFTVAVAVLWTPKMCELILLSQDTDTG